MAKISIGKKVSIKVAETIIPQMICLDFKLVYFLERIKKSRPLQINVPYISIAYILPVWPPRFGTRTVVE